MELKEVQNLFINEAKILGDYQLMTKTELANGYCDNEELARKFKEEGNQIKAYEHEALRSAYFSALMLRYWFKIYEWIQNSASLKLQNTDFVDWLAECLNDAFYYRGWRWEYQAVVKNGKFIEWKLDENGNKIINENYWLLDPNAPDKNINFFIKAKRAKVYQFYNKDIRKTCVINYSLDNMQDENGDYATNYAGAIVEPDSLNVSSLINLLLKRGESLEALIIDGIANGNTIKQTKEIRLNKQLNEDNEEEYVNYKNSFDIRKLVKHLNQIDENFIMSFCKVYDVEKVEANLLYDKLKKMDNTKLYKYIQKTLIEIKEDKNLIGCLL